MSVTLNLLAEIAGATLHPASAGDLQVSDIGINAAEVPADGIFAAVPGTRSHGARYAHQSQGVAVLTDAAGYEILQEAGDPPPVLLVDEVRPILGRVADAVYGHPSAEMTVIGITGTSGKTTTTYLLEGALMAAGRRVGLIGTTGTRINGRTVPSHLTTPEAPELHKLFRTMADEGVTHVVMEVSSHAVMLGRVGGLAFDVTAFLNLSQDHLDFHDTMDEYFAAKALLFDPAGDLHAPRTVICTDDAWGQRMAELADGPGVRVTTAATMAANPPVEDADWVAGPPEVAINGLQHVVVRGPERDVDLEVPLPGAFNIANATVAWALLDAVGCATDEARAGLSDVAVPGRMERIDEGQDFLAVVDYAHKPAAVGAALDTLRDHLDGRLIIVFGAGGNRDRTKRAKMGAEAVRAADEIIITDDNPRHEDPEAIRQDIIAGAEEAAARRGDGQRPRIHNIAGRAAAIAAAVQLAGPGDAVIVAGKGHETGQDVGGHMHPFDDRIELRRALRDARGDQK
ncbi:UDP-N-acetylmuramoyl-L-alanyl-D-glutamate--2,6-diaminopimelate ligase [Corynebacterium sp. TAE3-ERU12]|uniref:UDP-N-acetylmuramoyl-L-alanyl-D-glutamate--2, 6-diaminopimelate ligase n=1 Tax=Corynebacterium sp. TAE3-ERU12 TaxID=2849491 RepID=UPI001C450E7A|nr:UDP-N-acetylmuramoyl-L-alanyl-D-glutamate--2,6-diaminopimelate ligase [Corynebacterium sp. TAE3-ERU12]MBV7296226.1 UDP-N-acetylmuramoyl-L-alanyl-D-glutamate--2,6-diaminopimelate ligase [Corynebacterium sp. TAE3-ERU12]